MKVVFLSALCIFIFPIKLHSQNTFINPQINLIGFNTWAITPKSDTIFQRQYMPLYDCGFGLSNNFSTKSPFYIDIGANYKTYGERCCKDMIADNGYGVSKYTFIDATLSPKYYFNNKFFFGVLIKVNWILKAKSFQNNTNFFIPFEKSQMDIWKRKDMPKESINLTFASTGISIGKEFKLKKSQVAIINIYAESPFRSINKFTAELANGYFIYRNIGISVGYGLRDKNYYHKK